MSILHLADCPPRPWKNGLGRTRDLAIHPPGAGMDDFLWRVSVAEVTAAAPFSAYPGIDRVIALLDGDGFTMHLGDGHEHSLTAPCTPFAFAGSFDSEVIAEALDAYNAAAARICAARGVAFVDITPVSRERGAEPEMLVEDALHPSAAMYAEWTARAFPVAQGLLSNARTEACTE